MIKNKAGQKVLVFAYDIANNTPKTGDASNITAYISRDGAAPAQSNDVNPSELDAVNMPGVYAFDLMRDESNCDTFFMSAASVTENVQLDPVRIETKGLADNYFGKLRMQNKSTGVITIYDDDGVTPILIETPTDDGEDITITPSVPEE